MKKRIWQARMVRKILVMLLTFSMVLGVVQGIAIQADAATDIDLTEYEFSYNKHNGGMNPNAVYLKVGTGATDYTVIPEGTYTPADENSGCFLGETRLTDASGKAEGVQRVSANSNGLLKCVKSGTRTTINDNGDKLIIKGTFTYDNDTSRRLIMPTLELAYDKDANTWTVTKVTEEEEPAVEDASNYQFTVYDGLNNNANNFFVQSDPALTSADGKYVAVEDGSSGIWKNGTKLDANIRPYTEDNVKYCRVGTTDFVDENLGGVKDDILVVRGDFYRADNNATIRLPELTFCFKGTTWEVYQEIVTVQVDMSEANFQFTGQSGTSQASKTLIYMVDDGKVDKSQLQGQTTFKPSDDDSGFWVGSTKLTADQSAIYLQQDVKTWRFGDNYANYVSGILTIKGTFTATGEDGTIYHVILPTLRLQYTENGWNFDLLNGDFNSDNKTDIRDLVRLKRYIVAPSDVSIADNVTYNNDGFINFEDAQDLRWALVCDYTYDEYAGVAYGIPSYSTTKTLERMAYSGPKIGTWDGTEYLATSTFTPYTDAEIDEAFQKYKSAGFTLISSRGVASYVPSSMNNTAFEVFMDAAKRNELKVIVDLRYVDEIRDGFWNNPANFETTFVTSSGKYTNGAFKNWYQQVVYNRLKTAAVTYPDVMAGVIISDEWAYAEAEIYSNIVTAIRQLEQDLKTSGTIKQDWILMTSQLPISTYDNESHNVCGVSLEGKGVEALTGASTETDKSSSYSTYLNKYGIHGMFTYDIYPLWEHSLKGCIVDEDWFPNLKQVAEFGLAQGMKKTGITIQSCAISGTSVASRYAPIEKADIGFQVYTALAYGMKQMNYFCYNASVDTSVTDYMTNKDKIYTSVQSVNAELEQFDHILMNYQWKGALDLTNATGNGSTVDSDRLASAKVSGARAIVGCMKDIYGFDGYMVANAAGPRTTSASKVTLTFQHADKAVVYENGVAKEVTLTDGVIELDVPVGAGMFVIPVLSK